VAINAETLKAGGPGAPARPLAVSRARTSRRILLDRLASRTVVVGGIVIISAICAILFVILAEVWPLFRPPRVEAIARVAGPGAAAPGQSLGVDEYRETASVVTAAGTLALVPLRPGAPAPPPVALQGLDGARVTTVAAAEGNRYAVGTSDGRVIPFEMMYDVRFDAGRRVVSAKPGFAPATVVDPAARRPVLRLAAAASPSGPVTVAQLGPRELAVQTVVERKALVGAPRREEALQTLTAAVDGDVTAMQIDGRGDNLFLGTSAGEVVRYELGGRETPRVAESVRVGSAPVTTLGFLIGSRTLVAGDQAGVVSTWQVVPPPTGGGARLTRVNAFEPHGAPVVAVSASRRDKGFVTVDADGGVKLRYGTSGQTLLTFSQDRERLSGVTFAPKADGVITLDDTGRIAHWALANPHPEITLRTLFGKVWYEGYSRPEWVWQSTGGTDDFESKLSLTPLVYGTLKGTFYALLFAVPLALLAAVYVSEFMHPVVKGYVKPAVEIMAALPSVVLGFLAGLWLAPAVERIVPGLFVMPLVQVVMILGALMLWRTLPVAVRGRFRQGTEVFLLIPVVLLGAWVAFALGGLVEQRLLAGDYRGWLLSALGLTYDQRNSLVVGVAMGFAVVPIIFTIAEDSLSNVPQHLRAGSLALGATRWQTALRIVLPTGSPGIFSAVMIGFGRAVGETMIVLMATGNTPVMDANIFSGFRALSANIAVELPEAPEQGTLFRVLFLAALLLFCLTFALNTVAEMVRLRLRRKYRYL
jgi:phosphate transport system permease protein